MVKYLLFLWLISLGSINAQESSFLSQLFLDLPIDSNIDSLLNSINNNESIESDSSFLIEFKTKECKMYQGKFSDHQLFEHLTKNSIIVFCGDSTPHSIDNFNVDLIFDFTEFEDDIMVKEYEQLKAKMSNYFERNGDETEIFADGRKEIVSSEFKVGNSIDISLYYSTGGCSGPPILVIGFSK